MPDSEVALQIIPQRGRQIAHLVKRLGAASVDPMQNLAGAICALPSARDDLRDLIQRQVAKVGARGRRLAGDLAIFVHGKLF